jgi:hypothetical protein
LGERERQACGSKEAGSEDPAPVALDLNYVRGLKALGSLNHLELDCRSLLEVAVAVALDGRIVDKNVFTLVALNEAVPFGGIEPLNGSSFSIATHDFTSTPSSVMLSVLLAFQADRTRLRALPRYLSFRTQKCCKSTNAK